MQQAETSRSRSTRKKRAAIPRYVLFFVSYTLDEVVRGFPRLLPQSSNLTNAFWHKKTSGFDGFALAKGLIRGLNRYPNRP